MTILYLDFETRSRCDLLAKGVYNYARHPSTTVLCMSYAFDDEDVQTWDGDDKFPARVRNHKGLIYAHNAAFERLICRNVLELDYRLDQFYCTAVQAAANCAPRSLEDIGRFTSSNMRKDHKGKALIKKLCVPRADGTFNNDPDLLKEMIAYCEQDVWTMRAISKMLRPLTAEELLDYHVNERINDRGVLLDKPLAEAAVKYAEAEVVEIQQIVKEVTNGEITSVRSPKMKEWVRVRVGPTALGFMKVNEDGEERYSLDKTVRANLLALADENESEVPHDVAEVIQCADDLWSSSVAKFNRLASLADEDDCRVRGAFVFNGGSATGRASSYGAQVHNFPRKSHNDALNARESIIQGAPIVPKYGKRVTDVLKQMLRPALIPHAGKKLVVADWSSIEARVTPWMTDTPHGEKKLELFASGADVYKHNASQMFNVSIDQVDDSQRQRGKITELALAFAGGTGALANMARAYGMTFTEAESQRMVDAWRRANVWGPIYWSLLEQAYHRAMRNKGREITAGRVTYLFDGVHLWYALPSGRVLCYPHARFDGDGSLSYAKAAWKPAQDAREWPRARLWKGLAVENMVQATANDLLRHALRQIPNVVLHVHDEIVVESDTPEETAEFVKKIMSTPPSWCAGLPLSADVKIMERYGK
jgi:DNA polymerase